MQIKVKCHCCEGTGEIELPRHLSKTLDVVRKHGPICAAKAAILLKIAHCAANNRLMNLVIAGLAKRDDRVTRDKPYTAINTPSPRAKRKTACGNIR